MVKNGGGRVCHSNLRIGMFPRVLWAAVCAFFCIMGLNPECIPRSAIPVAVRQ